MTILKKAGALVLILFCGIVLVFCVVSFLKAIGVFFASQQDAFDVGFLLGTILGCALFGFVFYKLMRYGIKVLHSSAISREDNAPDSGH